MAIFNSGLISKSFSEVTMLIPPCFLFLLERLYKLQVIIEKTLCPSVLRGKIFLSWVFKWQASGTFIHSTTPYCMHKQIFRWWDLEVQMYFVFIYHITFFFWHHNPYKHTQIYPVFQVQFLQNSTTVNESDASASVDIQLQIAPFAILQSNINVTLSVMPGNNATGTYSSYRWFN